MQSKTNNSEAAKTYKKKESHFDSNSADYIKLVAMPLNPSKSVSNVNGMNVILTKKCENNDVENDVTTMDENLQLDLPNIDNIEEAENGDHESNNNVDDDVLRISVPEDEKVSLNVANVDNRDEIGKS